MNTKEKIKDLIWNNRNEILHRYIGIEFITNINFEMVKYIDKYGLNVDPQNVIILDNCLVFTHESFYFIDNDKLTAIPYCNLTRAIPGTDGSLKFQMEGTNQFISFKDDNLLPDKAAELFDQIIKLIINDPIPYKEQLRAEEKQIRTGSIVGKVLMVAFLGLILFVVVTCTRYCSEESKIEKRNQAISDSLEYETLKSKAELSKINNLLNEANKFESGENSSAYRDELGHIVVSRKYQINSGKYFGCKHQDYFHDLVNFAVRGDNTTFTTLLNTGLLSGECTHFRFGETVTVKETNYDKTEVRVSRVGESISYWTVVEAIE